MHPYHDARAKGYRRIFTKKLDIKSTSVSSPPGLLIEICEQMKSEALKESENEEKGRENSGRDSSNSASRVPILITAAVLVFGVYANSLLFNRKNPSSKMGSRRGQRYAEFAEAIADKTRVDQAWLEGSKDHLYSVDVTGLADHPDIVSKLVVLDADSDTQDFIRTRCALPFEFHANFITDLLSSFVTF